MYYNGITIDLVDLLSHGQTPPLVKGVKIKDIIALVGYPDPDNSYSYEEILNGKKVYCEKYCYGNISMNIYDGIVEFMSIKFVNPKIHQHPFFHINGFDIFKNMCRTKFIKIISEHLKMSNISIVKYPSLGFVTVSYHVESNFIILHFGYKQHNNHLMEILYEV